MEHQHITENTVRNNVAMDGYWLRECTLMFVRCWPLAADSSTIVGAREKRPLADGKGSARARTLNGALFVQIDLKGNIWCIFL